MASITRYNLVAAPGYIPIPLDMFIYILSFVNLPGLGRLAADGSNHMPIRQQGKKLLPAMYFLSSRILLLLGKVLILVVK